MLGLSISLSNFLCALNVRKLHLNPLRSTILLRQLLGNFVDENGEDSVVTENKNLFFQVSKV